MLNYTSSHENMKEALLNPLQWTESLKFNIIKSCSNLLFMESRGLLWHFRPVSQIICTGDCSVSPQHILQIRFLQNKRPKYYHHLHFFCQANMRSILFVKCLKFILSSGVTGLFSEAAILLRRMYHSFIFLLANLTGHFKIS